MLGGWYCRYLGAMGVGRPRSVHVEEVECGLQNETRTWPREVASHGNGGMVHMRTAVVLC